jgi:hypothetical protein
MAGQHRIDRQICKFSKVFVNLKEKNLELSLHHGSDNTSSQLRVLSADRRAI